MKMLEANKPRQCDLSLPNQCMLKCRMCNFWKEDLTYKDPNWLKVDDYRKLLYELKDFAGKPFLVSFGGGEPLLYADKLLDIVRICKELGFQTHFPTNGYLIDDEMAERIAQVGVLSVGISLDSLNEKIHDSLRGKKGCWKRVMRTIEFLGRYCPEVSINILTIIMEANLDGIIDLTKWVYEQPGLHGIVFQAIQRPFNSDSPEDWHELEEYADLWPRDALKVNAIIDELIALRRTRQKAFKISNPVTQLEVFKLYFSNPKNFIKPLRCHLGDNVIRVDSFGNIILCNEMELIGNIKENGMRKIWYSPKAEEVRARIHSCNKNCYHLVNCYYDGESL